MRRNVLADGKIAFLVTKISIGLLQVQWNGIVQPVLDPLLSQGVAERFAILHYDDIEVVNVLCVGHLPRGGNFAPGEKIVVPLCQDAAILIPSVEMWELHGKDTALNSFEAQVIGGKNVFPRSLRGASAQAACLFDPGKIITPH